MERMVKVAKYKRELHFHNMECGNMTINRDFSHTGGGGRALSMTRSEETETAKVDKIFDHVMKKKKKTWILARGIYLGLSDFYC